MPQTPNNLIVRCNSCGEGLKVPYYKQGDESLGIESILAVEPCEDCILASNDAAEDQAYESGYNDGLDAKLEDIEVLQGKIDDLQEEVESLKEQLKEKETIE